VKRSDVLACQLRALNHEQLAVMAARLAVSLALIADGNYISLDAAEGCADSALRNTGIPCVQELSPLAREVQS